MKKITNEILNKKLDKILKILETKIDPKGKDITPVSPISFQELLDSTNRTQYTDKDVVQSVKYHVPQQIEFFRLDKYVSEDELEKEYSNRGLLPAHPYSLTLFSKENEALMNEKKYIGTHWKDSNDNWCFAAFGRWGGRRRVSVRRPGRDWSDYWWFAGVRK